MATNLAALRGEAVGELTRWADGEWEMFAGPGPDVAAADMRVVPLGTLVGDDPSLSVAWQARIGEGHWRTDSSSEWHEWRRRTQACDASQT